MVNICDSDRTKYHQILIQMLLNPDWFTEICDIQVSLSGSLWSFLLDITLF